MIHPDRIGHIVLRVRSLERSRPFYTACAARGEQTAGRKADGHPQR